MHTLLLSVHIIVAFCLIASVLMQSSKGEGLAGAFGGGTFSSAVFGGRGAATFLVRATAVLAVLFALTSIGLTFMTRSGSVTSAVQKAAGTIPVPQQQAPVTTQPQTQPAAGQPTGQPAQTQTGTAKEPNIFDVNKPAQSGKAAPASSGKKTDQKKTSQPPK